MQVDLSLLVKRLIMQIIHKEKFLTDDECQKLIDLKSAVDPIDAIAGSGVNHAVRKSTVHWLNPEGFAKEIADRVIDEFDLHNAGFGRLKIPRRLQLTCYHVGGFYKWHRDSGSGAIAGRKVSVVLNLSGSYEGCELQFHNQTQIGQSKGSVTVFPSDQLHQVTTLTSGERWSLVFWLEV